ncbi:keratin-associated protein 5-4 [Polyodon spathula]|uniref:keratin-associated protein 5-4 n=1 Tax=Polyodon spathula TaxID=7913 RepID=UPI001B7E2B62|nr:keratin-associated protein 5-4 [Polyodon spathula]
MGALWLQQCIRSRGLCPSCCQCEKCAPCGGCEYCLACAESCDCRVPSLRGCLDSACPRSTDCLQVSTCCPLCDCACTWQPPECESVNCLCFEIKMR